MIALIRADRRSGPFPKWVVKSLASGEIAANTGAPTQSRGVISAKRVIGNRSSIPSTKSSTKPRSQTLPLCGESFPKVSAFAAGQVLSRDVSASAFLQAANCEMIIFVV
jgi:hypothetical protein